MKTLKKLLALFLAVLMILSASSVAAFAEDENPAEDPAPSESEEVDTNPFAIFGRFFERIANLMNIVFRFLETLLTGNGDKALGDL